LRAATPRASGYNQGNACAGQETVLRARKLEKLQKDGNFYMTIG
jgi:hypothetical protein